MANSDHSRRSPVLTYRPGHELGCPTCGRAAWHVGRVSAECAHCETALPLSGDTGHIIELRRAA